MFDSVLPVLRASFLVMASDESGGPQSPVAKRLRAIQDAQGVNGAALAGRLGLSPQRWSNFLNGKPLNREVAIKLVQVVPGLTLDWIYLGKFDGLTVALAQKLGLIPDEKAKRKA